MFLAAVAATTGIGSVVVLLLRTPLSPAALAPLLVVVAVIAVLVGLGGTSVWNRVGLIRISRLRPDALVFLARREPTLAPDLPAFLYRKNVTADVADKWVPAVVDERGMAAWSSGPRPKELFLIPWDEIGEVEATAFQSLQGHDRFGVAVDVRPYPTPLLVRVGYSMFGLQTAFDRTGTILVSEAVNARRPVREPS
ncbi:hypothetical protein BH09ACT5_BH09ACT5_11460 [soil metagenome]